MFDRFSKEARLAAARAAAEAKAAEAHDDEQDVEADDDETNTTDYRQRAAALLGRHRF